MNGTGGRSNGGKCVAAGLRAVKLDDVPVSMEAIPCCCTPVPAKLLYSDFVFCPGGLYPSLPSLGGVGKVFNACAVVAGVELVAPGQYC